MLFLNVGGEALELTGQKCHFYHFRFATNADLRVKALTSVMSADGTLGKRVYAINQNYSWGQDMEGATERFAKQYGYEVVGKTLHEVNKIQDFAPTSRASARPIPTPSSPATGPTTCCC